jgi:signal peptidase II
MSDGDDSKLSDKSGSPASKEELPTTSADDGDAKITGGKPVKSVAASAVAAGVSGMQWAFLMVVALVTAGLDLWSKAWAIKALSIANIRAVPLCTPPPGGTHYQYQRFPSREIVVLRNYLDFQYAENCGGAWGLLHGAREGLRKPFFLLVTIGAVIFILHLYRGLEQGQRAMRWALPLVLGGAIGNLADRTRLGYVVDFIHAHWRDKFHWPTFNVADIAITVGIGLMLLEYILGPKKAPPVKAKAKPAATA